MYIRKSVKEELEKYIKTLVTIDEDTHCWHVNAGSRDGYARLDFIRVSEEASNWLKKVTGNRRFVQMHKIMFLLSGGRLPPTKPLCLHKCGMLSRDSRSCVNPKHLKQGNHSDNAADLDSFAKRVRSGKIRKTMTQQQKDEIRKMLLDEVSFRKIAEHFDIHMSCITQTHAPRVEKELNIILPQRTKQ